AIFQAGDGLTEASALKRSPPMLLGSGYRQQLAIEISNDLKAQVADLKQQAATGGQPVFTELLSKGVFWGGVTANPDGTVDLSQLASVDPDLIVKPFGVKGREATIRRFVEGGWQVHFGMATQPRIAKNCSATPIPNVVGTGPDCADPDMDGVKDEITEGQ